MTGSKCTVRGCKNSHKSLSEWKNSICDDHGILRKDCDCKLPFSLHYYPRDDVIREKWINAIRPYNRPSRNSVVSLYYANQCLKGHWLD